MHVPVIVLSCTVAVTLKSLLTRKWLNQILKCTFEHDVNQCLDLSVFYMPENGQIKWPYVYIFVDENQGPKTYVFICPKTVK